MPSRNVLKSDVEHTYYHLYARGSNKQSIFLEPADYEYFIGLFARYLSKQQAVSSVGVPYPHYAGDLELLAYCLMPNHIHLLIYQTAAGTMSGFMRSLMTSYSRYFNLKYKRTGSLFESRYKASMVDQDNYLMHISRYIHLNPRSWKRYSYSSLQFYEKGNEPEWLLTGRVTSMFDTRQKYLTFVADYEQHKRLLDEIKHELANI